MKEETASNKPEDIAPSQTDSPRPPLAVRVPSTDLTVTPVRALDDVALLARVREGLRQLK
jgi:hypothetical protein